MAKKKFRMETLLRIRENILNERRGELAKAYEAERIMETKRIETEGEVAATVENGRAMMCSGQVDVQYLLGLRRHEAYLQAMLQEIARNMELVRQEIEVRRRAVIEANKEFKIIEKLKEKQEARAAAESQRRDTKQMDEIAEVRAARGAREEAADVG